MWWTIRNGCFEKCPSWNDCSHFVCPPSAIARLWEQTQGGLPSTGLIERLDFQEDLKPTSALTPEKSIPGSALCQNQRFRLRCLWWCWWDCSLLQFSTSSSTVQISAASSFVESSAVIPASMLSSSFFTPTAPAVAIIVCPLSSNPITNLLR